jgi:hypothetical protein
MNEETIHFYLSPKILAEYLITPLDAILFHLQTDMRKDVSASERTLV